MVDLDLNMVLHQNGGREGSVSTPPSVASRFPVRHHRQQPPSAATSKKQLRMSGMKSKSRRRLVGGPPSSIRNISGDQQANTTTKKKSFIQRMFLLKMGNKNNKKFATSAHYHARSVSDTSSSLVSNPKQIENDPISLEKIIASGPRSSGGSGSSFQPATIPVATKLLQNCIKLLQSDDEEDCRAGLQQLKEMIVDKKDDIDDTASSLPFNALSRAIVYDNCTTTSFKGPQPHNAEYLLVRRLLLSFLCNGVDVVSNVNNDQPFGEESSTDDETISHDDNEVKSKPSWEESGDEENEVGDEERADPSLDILNIDIDNVDIEEQFAFGTFSYDTDEEIVDGDDYDDEEEFNSGGPQGRHLGNLHSLALDIVILALENVMEMKPQKIMAEPTENNEVSSLMDFGNGSRFWGPIAVSLIHNIEFLLPSAMDVCASSIQCLLLLHQLEPLTIQPLAQGTLFPHLVEAQDQGEVREHAKLEYCALQLLQRVDRCGDDNETMGTQLML